MTPASLDTACPPAQEVLVLIILVLTGSESGRYCLRQELIPRVRVQQLVLSVPKAHLRLPQNAFKLKPLPEVASLSRHFS